jgi:hypothetical protein
LNVLFVLRCSAELLDAKLFKIAKSIFRRWGDLSRFAEIRSVCRRWRMKLPPDGFGGFAGDEGQWLRRRGAPWRG